MSPPTVRAQITGYLAACGRPWDFAAHYDSLAPSALVAVDQRLMSKAAIGRTDFVRRQRLALKRSPVTRPLSWQLGETVSSDVAAERVTVLVRLTERTSHQAWLGAFVFTTGGGIEAACLLDPTAGDPDGAPPAMLARALGEFAAWAPTADLGTVNGILLSHGRLANKSDLTLRALPEARFTCQNSGQCCAIRFPIHVPPPAAVALAAVPWAELALPEPAVTAYPEGAAQTGRMACGDDGRCSALVGGWCTVHRAIGWQPFQPCARFPWHFVRVPDGVDITASFVCGTVARGIGRPLAEETPSLRRQVATVWAELPQVTGRVTLGDAGAWLGWSAYRSVEAAMLACLADLGRGGLDRRLHDVSQWLTGQMQAATPTTPWPIGPDSLPRHHGPLPTDDGPADRLLQSLTVGAPPDLVKDRMLGGGHFSAWTAGAGRGTASWLDEALLTRYLRTVLYRKPGLAEGGVAFVWGVVMLAAGLWVRETWFRALQADQAPDGAMQLETARLLDLTLLHSPWLTELAHHRPTRLAISDPAVWAGLLVH